MGKHFVCNARTSRCCDCERELMFFRKKWIWRGQCGSVLRKITRQYEWACKHVSLKSKNTREARPTVLKVATQRCDCPCLFRGIVENYWQFISKRLKRPWKPIVARTVPPIVFRRLYKISRPRQRASVVWVRYCCFFLCVLTRQAALCTFRHV